MTRFRQILAVFISFCVLSVQFSIAQTPPQPPQALQQSQEQLQQLVAPIALYPDSLIAQILPAATYPEQIVEARQFLLAHQGLSAEQLANEVNGQPWDVSVKALTQFPAVLANMNQNLAWTSELGDAYMNQQPSVTQAIQTMRQRAKQAGNLKSTSQQKVKQQGQTIVIEPAEPDIVYVPEYDPWLVYGGPVPVFPGWYPYPGMFLDGPGIAFGVGFGIGIFAGFGWGWHHWDFDWHRDGRVVFNHDTYISRSTTIINRDGLHAGGVHFHNGAGGRDFGTSPGIAGMHSSAFGGFAHGGVARANAFRGESSFGGFHAGGGGGFHGGGRR